MKGFKGGLVLALAIALQIGLALPCCAKGDSKEALAAVSKMLHTQDFIRSIHFDAVQVKTIDDKKVTLNYTYYADSKGNEAVIVNQKSQKVVYVTNFKGRFVSINGRVRKLPGDQPFPFDNPGTFLKSMHLEDVTPNNKLLIDSQSDRQIVVKMVRLGPPIGQVNNGGDSPVQMLKLTLNLPFYTLAKVEIFKSNLTETQDFVEFEYGSITNKKLPMSTLFRTPVLESQGLIHSKSVGVAPALNSSQKPQIQIKETWYSRVVVNDQIDRSVFNEEAY